MFVSFLLTFNLIKKNFIHLRQFEKNKTAKNKNVTLLISISYMHKVALKIKKFVYITNYLSNIQN